MNYLEYEKLLQSISKAPKYCKEVVDSCNKYICPGEDNIVNVDSKKIIDSIIYKTTYLEKEILFLDFKDFKHGNLILDDLTSLEAIFNKIKNILNIDKNILIHIEGHITKYKYFLEEKIYGKKITENKNELLDNNLNLENLFTFSKDDFEYITENDHFSRYRNNTPTLNENYVRVNVIKEALYLMPTDSIAKITSLCDICNVDLASYNEIIVNLHSNNFFLIKDSNILSITLDIDPINKKDKILVLENNIKEYELPVLRTTNCMELSTAYIQISSNVSSEDRCINEELINRYYLHEKLNTIYQSSELKEIVYQYTTEKSISSSFTKERISDLICNIFTASSIPLHPEKLNDIMSTIFYKILVYNQDFNNIKKEN